MRLATPLAGALVALAFTVTQASALAAPPAGPAAPPSHATAEAPSARASITLDVGKSSAWVGQAVPITVRAYFRGVEGVTLEGAPQIVSKEVVTSELGSEPKQTTTIIGGQSTLVATWTGTFTPSAAGPVDLAIELPVRLRYREAAPRVVRDVDEEDPFGGLGAGDPFDASIFDRMRRMMDQMRQPLGRVREQTATLKAAAHVDALALPIADQPATFSGAVGRFDVTASASSTHLHGSEPLTLRIAVDGQGDLDRVDLPGVATSDTWKAYPPKLIADTMAPGKRRAPRVFEQVLVPLRGGDLTVPAVSLTAFDPAAGRYVTHATRPLSITVDAATAADPATPPPAASESATLPAPAAPVGITTAPIAPIRAWSVLLGVAPVLLLVAAALLAGAVRRLRLERSLRRAMRKAAEENAAGWFFTSARSLIATRLARRWGVDPGDVNASSIRERLGARGDALAEIVAADDSVRFGRAGFARDDLVALCSSVEKSLRGAS